MPESRVLMCKAHTREGHLGREGRGGGPTRGPSVGVFRVCLMRFAGPSSPACSQVCQWIPHTPDATHALTLLPHPVPPNTYTRCVPRMWCCPRAQSLWWGTAWLSARSRRARTKSEGGARGLWRCTAMRLSADYDIPAFVTPLCLDRLVPCVAHAWSFCMC